MNNVMVKHGEKLLFLAVVAVGVFVVMQKFDWLFPASGVGRSEQMMIDKIKQELQTKQPPKYEMPPYKEMLRASIEGNGIADRIEARGTLPARLVHESPIIREEVSADIVYASMGGVSGLSVSSTRGSVQLSWDAPRTNKCSIEQYEIFRNGNPTPIATTMMTTYTDSGLKAETEYSYSVRAIGKIDTSDDETVEYRWPRNSGELKIEGETCYTPKTSPKIAKTPSDLELVLRGVNKGETVLAMIYGKKWDSSENKWIEYKYGASFKVGDKVRPYYTTRLMKKEYLETGYIFVSHTEETRIFKEEKTIIRRLPDGGFERVKVFVDRPYRVKTATLRKENGTETITLEFWPTKPPTGVKSEKPEPKPNKKKDNTIGGIRERANNAQGKDGEIVEATYDTTGWRKISTTRSWKFTAPKGWSGADANPTLRTLGLKGVSSLLYDGYPFAMIEPNNLNAGVVAVELNGEAIRTSGIKEKGTEGLTQYLNKYLMKIDVGASDVKVIEKPKAIKVNGKTLVRALINYNADGSKNTLYIYMTGVSGKPMLVMIGGSKQVIDSKGDLMDAIAASIK